VVPGYVLRIHLFTSSPDNNHLNVLGSWTIVPEHSPPELLRNGNLRELRSRAYQPEWHSGGQGFEPHSASPSFWSGCSSKNP